MSMNVGEIDAGHEKSDPMKFVSEAEPKNGIGKSVEKGQGPLKEALCFSKMCIVS